MCSGRSGGTRRVTRSTAASTDGTGRNESAGNRRPMVKDHQGAHVVDSSVVGGTAVRLRATSRLDEQIGAPQAAVRVVEQVAQQRRGGTEGNGAHRPERTARHGVAAAHRSTRR